MKGVRAEDHTIICTEKPTTLPGERERGLHMKPIRVIPVNARHKLHQASRLDYAKLYTVEFNVKVCFIGQVHKSSIEQLILDYKSFHPAIKPREEEKQPSAVEYAYGGVAVNEWKASSPAAPATSYSTSHVGYFPIESGIKFQQNLPSGPTQFIPHDTEANGQSGPTAGNDEEIGAKPPTSEQLTSPAAPGQLQRSSSAGGMAAVGAGMYAAGAATVYVVGAAYVGNALKPK
jgi:hypothetical protein